MIPHNQPLITDEDRQAMDAVLRSGWLAQGPRVAALERSFEDHYFGGKACAVSSGTAALFLALKGLGVESGDRVALPTYACSALLNAVYMLEATPRIVDVLPKSFCIDPASVEQYAADANYIIAVHTYGEPAIIHDLLKPGRKVIEDCCHALGGMGLNGPVGALGDASIFSFYATKIITGGQGGLVWAKKQTVVDSVFDYRQFDCRETYEPRFNYQMTDIQAALISSQMGRLEQIRVCRQSIAKRYLAALNRGLAVQSGLVEPGRMAYRFVVVSPDLESRDALRKHLEKAGVCCAVPIERYELLHRYLGLNSKRFPTAENLVDTTLSLPIHPSMSESQIEQVVEGIGRFRL